MSDIIDDIDALIASELDEHGVPLDDYSADRYPKCELCSAHWHGLPKASGCPGGHATDVEIEAWRDKQHSVLYHLTYETVDGMTQVMVIPPESQVGSYTFNEAAARFEATFTPADVPDGFDVIGFVDACDDTAVDSSND